jgi:hypothetical protein
VPAVAFLRDNCGVHFEDDWGSLGAGRCVLLLNPVALYEEGGIHAVVSKVRVVQLWVGRHPSPFKPCSMFQALMKE